MNELNVLFYLINFEFIATVTNRVVVSLFVLSVGKGRAVKKIVPIEELIVFLIVFLESDGFMLGDA